MTTPTPTPTPTPALDTLDLVLSTDLGKAIDKVLAVDKAVRK